MQRLRTNHLYVAVSLTMLAIAGSGCGGDAPTSPATDTSGPTPDSSDSNIGTTDTADPPEKVSVPENLPAAEQEAAAAILNLGGHVDQESSGHVQAVDLTATNIGNADLEQLQAFSHLQGLILTDTEISDDGLKHLAGLPSLTTLELYRTSIGDGGLKHLSELNRLAGLYLKGTKISNDGLAHIAGLQSLTQLSLSNTEITDAGLRHLSGLTKLESLMIEDTKVTAEGIIKNLSELKQLELIRAAGTQISVDSIADIRQALPGVRVTGP